MKITEIEINKFRNLQGVDIHFGEYLNAIAGQNGTSKTSILGLIGHIFTYPRKYKTLAGKPYTTEFSEIFRFAYPDYEKAGDHNWLTKLDNGKAVPAVSTDRKESTRKQTTLRVRVGRSKEGSAKIKLPVIYLGMGRLFPLTLEKAIKNNASELSEDEAKEFSDLHNEILLMVDEPVTPESITSSSKTFYAPKTDKYNHLGNSAGQDNLGQIITALVSFKRLRNEIGKAYEGGILLIDELDASLFPAAQMKLVEKLYKKAMELNLQIFFTTHSLEVLAETNKKRNSKIIFLDKSEGKIVPKYNLDPQALAKNLLVLGPDALKEISEKQYIYCEDDEAVDMLKCILPKHLKDEVAIISTKLGNGELKNIARRKIPDFHKSIIVLDGDASTGSLKNVISLPGQAGPDRLLYDFLRESKDEAFSKIQKGYNKQFCFRDANLGSSTDDSRARDIVKRWYVSQKKYWGNNGGRVWKMWLKEHEELTSSFITRFEETMSNK